MDGRLSRAETGGFDQDRGGLVDPTRMTDGNASGDKGPAARATSPMVNLTRTALRRDNRINRISRENSNYMTLRFFTRIVVC
jgi:hypothetical protein